MLTWNPTVLERQLQCIAQAIDAAGRPGQLSIYSGERLDPEIDLPPNQLLATIPLSFPCTSSLQNGTLMLTPPMTVMCLTSGVARWARLTDGDSQWVVDVSVGETGSQADLILSSTQIYEGGWLTVDSIQWSTQVNI